MHSIYFLVVNSRVLFFVFPFSYTRPTCYYTCCSMQQKQGHMLFYNPMFERVLPHPFMHLCSSCCFSTNVCVSMGGRGSCSQIPRSLDVSCVVLQQFHLASITLSHHPIRPPLGNPCKSCLPGSDLVLLSHCLLPTDTLTCRLT